MYQLCLLKLRIPVVIIASRSVDLLFQRFCMNPSLTHPLFSRSVVSTGIYSICTTMLDRMGYWQGRIRTLNIINAAVPDKQKWLIFIVSDFRLRDSRLLSPSLYLSSLHSNSFIVLCNISVEIYYTRFAETKAVH